MKGDVIIGLQYGDEGKGKILVAMIQKNKYDYCIRFNGGPNAGHSIYKDGIKYITHQIPSGIVYGLKCIIGPNCVVDINKLEKEISELESLGIKNVRTNLLISYNAHIIDLKHIEYDTKSNMIGTTGSGIGPTYSDKALRTGQRINDIKRNNIICGCKVIDCYEELNKKKDIKLIYEGAQGFMLDINYGNYPYVTSSNCLASSVCTTGVSHKNIENVIGVCKIYNTYLGTMEFQPENENDLVLLQREGEELGNTTGRVRQCNWLNLDELLKAIKINGVDKLIINKCDIIKNVGVYKLYHLDKLIAFNTFLEMENYIKEIITDKIDIIFSGHPYLL